MSGAGKSFSITLKYEIPVEKNESNLILKGNYSDKIENKGILWNPSFLNEFEVNAGNDEWVGAPGGDELAENIFINQYLKTIIFEDNDDER